MIFIQIIRISQSTCLTVVPSPDLGGPAWHEKMWFQRDIIQRAMLASFLLSGQKFVQNSCLNEFRSPGLRGACSVEKAIGLKVTKCEGECSLRFFHVSGQTFVQTSCLKVFPSPGLGEPAACEKILL